MKGFYSIRESLIKNSNYLKPAPLLQVASFLGMLQTKNQSNDKQKIHNLKNTNHVITEAENGIIAVDKTKHEEFDIILMDMQMPVMDGYNAAEEIRKWEQQTNHAQIAIIAVTAYALKDEQEKSISVGCDQHLSSPILKDSLMKVLDNILAT